ncbi:MAG TPA: type II toxin-antitoxin system RelE/ParE family toxin [Tepidisphaeraceae bacterium]|nr:type II toxin-antitoxin system RelE/ParE family toxin [Tepidisphaeraceae bacterium]
MRFRVHLTSTAAADAEAAYLHIAESAPRAAVRWFNGLVDVVASLDSFPTRCEIARESVKAGEEIRQMLYGRRPHIHRLLFIVRGQDVYILHIRHSARRAMAVGDITLPPTVP